MLGENVDMSLISTASCNLISLISIMQSLMSVVMDVLIVMTRLSCLSGMSSTRRSHVNNTSSNFFRTKQEVTDLSPICRTMPRNSNNVNLTSVMIHH